MKCSPSGAARKTANIGAACRSAKLSDLGPQGRPAVESWFEEVRTGLFELEVPPAGAGLFAANGTEIAGVQRARRGIAGSTWYDKSNLWVRGEFERDGSKVQYQLDA
jgi:hypothetical protein